VNRRGDEAVSTATKLRPGWIPGMGKRIFSLSKHPDQLWSHTASYAMATEGFFSGFKWPGYEADHSQSIANVKNARRWPLLPHKLSGRVHTVFASICLENNTSRYSRIRKNQLDATGIDVYSHKLMRINIYTCGI